MGDLSCPIVLSLLCWIRAYMYIVLKPVYTDSDVWRCSWARAVKSSRESNLFLNQWPLRFSKIMTIQYPRLVVICILYNFTVDIKQCMQRMCAWILGSKEFYKNFMLQNQPKTTILVTSKLKAFLYWRFSPFNFNCNKTLKTKYLQCSQDFIILTLPITVTDYNSGSYITEELSHL